MAMGAVPPEETPPSLRGRKPRPMATSRSMAAMKSVAMRYF
jgi:hypothetical protein